MSWVGCLVDLRHQCGDHCLGYQWPAIWRFLPTFFIFGGLFCFCQLVLGQLVYCERVKVSSSIFKSTNVLTSPPPASPNSLAAYFAALSASRFPHAWGGVSSFWWPWQCINATSSGSHTANNRVKVFSLFSMSFPLAIRRPLPLYKAPCTCKVVKAHLKSV